MFSAFTKLLCFRTSTVYFVSFTHASAHRILLQVIVERLTKMAKFIATKNKITTFELSYQLVDVLFPCYGLLMDIVWDRDSKFTSDFKKLEATLSISSTDYPQFDGRTK